MAILKAERSVIPDRPSPRKEPLTEGINETKRGRDWTTLNDDELITFAKKFIRGKKIGGRKELEKADSGLYQALSRRKLLDGIGLERRHRGWISMGADELLAVADSFIEVNGLSGRGALARADPGMYDALKRRKLLDHVERDNSRGERRDWTSMSDDEIVGFARSFFEEKEIHGRKELSKADAGLYQALKKKKLLDSVGLEKKRRDWGTIDELVSFARNFIEENGIDCGGKLKKENPMLYEALRKRKMLEFVFSSIESENQSSALTEVIDSVREFGDAG